MPACLRAHRACVRAGCPSGSLLLRTLGREGPDDGVRVGVLKPKRSGKCVGRATDHPAEESCSPICGVWCTCETPWEMDTLWEERVRVGTQACFPRIPTPVPSGLRVQQAQALARPWVVTCSSNCWSSQEF